MKKTELFLVMGLLLIVWGSASVYAGGGFDDIANKAKKANETVRNVNEVIRDIDQTVEGVGSAKEGVGDIGKDTQGVLGIENPPQQQTPAQTSTTAPAQAPGQVQTTPPGAVPLPPLPQITLTMPPRDGGYKVNVTSAQLRQLLEIRDQRNYLQYLRNSGYITEDEYKRRDLSFEQAEADIILPIAQADQFAYIYADEYIKGEHKKILANLESPLACARNTSNSWICCSTTPGNKSII